MDAFMLLVMLSSTQVVQVPNIPTLEDCEKLGISISRNLSIEGNFQCYQTKTTVKALPSEQERIKETTRNYRSKKATQR